MLSYDEFRRNCEELESAIERACNACGRKQDAVKILPVTKNHAAIAVEYANRRGFERVGENRVQEALSKMSECSTLDLNLGWELIGHLQSNKVKFCVGKFERIQSVDSVKIVEKLEASAAMLASHNLGFRQNILLQVNSGKDPAKFGAEIEDAEMIVEKILNARHLNLEGFMAIAPLDEKRDSARAAFSELRKMRDAFEEKFCRKFPELSMGMSGDLEDAIKEGSTLVRVGTALFGERNYS